MPDSDILVLSASDIDSILTREEDEIIRRVRSAYLAHGAGKSNLPQSAFLRFPGNDKNRIIALPAYLGDGFNIAGIKWISSFPENIHTGIERASAIIIVNSLSTGRPVAILEGSLISAKRTAASASLAAEYLAEESISQVGVIGCGTINFEVLRFLLATRPYLTAIRFYDSDPSRSHELASRCAEISPAVGLAVENNLQEILASCKLISIATTATSPHIFDPCLFCAGATVLHISLRDLSPQIILKSWNIVDDVEHVCRAGTSIHLAEQEVSNRRFIAGTLADVMSSRCGFDKGTGQTTVFSPFGLGILDLAVANFVLEKARTIGCGLTLRGFHPGSVSAVETVAS